MTKRKSPPVPAETVSEPTPLGTLPSAKPAVWEKGGPSPNPKGRPPKGWEGPVTAKMNTKVETTIGGGFATVTLRTLLDHITQAEARDKGGRSLKLWRVRLRYEEELLRRHAEALDPVNATAERVRKETAASDAFLHAVEKIAPGYIDAMSVIAKLKERGIKPAASKGKSGKK